MKAQILTPIFKGEKHQIVYAVFGRTDIKEGKNDKIEDGYEFGENISICIPAKYQAAKEDRLYIITRFDKKTRFTELTPLSVDGACAGAEVIKDIPAGTKLRFHTSYWA